MKLWAVFSGKQMMTRTIRRTRREAIEVVANAGQWEHMMECGYRCRRITVTVEGES